MTRLSILFLFFIATALGLDSLSVQDEKSSGSVVGNGSVSTNQKAQSTGSRLAAQGDTKITAHDYKSDPELVLPGFPTKDGEFELVTSPSKNLEDVKTVEKEPAVATYDEPEVAVSMEKPKTTAKQGMKKTTGTTEGPEMQIPEVASDKSGVELEKAEPYVELVEEAESTGGVKSTTPSGSSEEDRKKGRHRHGGRHHHHHHKCSSEEVDSLPNNDKLRRVLQDTFRQQLSLRKNPELITASSESAGDSLIPQLGARRYILRGSNIQTPKSMPGSINNEEETPRVLIFRRQRRASSAKNPQDPSISNQKETAGGVSYSVNFGSETPSKAKPQLSSSTHRNRTKRTLADGGKHMLVLDAHSAPSLDVSKESEEAMNSTKNTPVTTPTAGQKETAEIVKEPPKAHGENESGLIAVIVSSMLKESNESMETSQSSEGKERMELGKLFGEMEKGLVEGNEGSSSGSSEKHGRHHKHHGRKHYKHRHHHGKKHSSSSSSSKSKSMEEADEPRVLLLGEPDSGKLTLTEENTKVHIGKLFVENNIGMPPKPKGPKHRGPKHGGKSSSGSHSKEAENDKSSGSSANVILLPPPFGMRPPPPFEAPPPSDEHHSSSSKQYLKGLSFAFHANICTVMVIAFLVVTVFLLKIVKALVKRGGEDKKRKAEESSKTNGVINAPIY